MNELKSMIQKAVGQVDSTPVAQHHNLNDLLIEMSRWGRPRLGMYGVEWHCNIEVSVNMVGAKFEVASGFKHPTPIAALLEFRDRLNTALKNLGAKP
jgi:hypothetical protein